MSEELVVHSYAGDYKVFFEPTAFSSLDRYLKERAQWIIDAKVADLYAQVLAPVLALEPLIIEASEENKSLEHIPDYIEELMNRRAKRGQTLVAIGGGIIQDISCFISAVLFRGMPWVFYPTTLLAQADSCIGSKSSINVRRFKNIAGTFTPPKCIHLATDVLNTLTPTDVKSGIGEILKVHLIDGPASFDKLANDYSKLSQDRQTLLKYIRRSLEIKKKIIELDEFDAGPRNILNYGHSFGHAIESATNFGIPHGIAVTIGMDMANFVSVKLGRLPLERYKQIHACLKLNFSEYADYSIPTPKLFEALLRDKKNTSTAYVFILPDATGTIEKVSVPQNASLEGIVETYLAQELRS